jgi:hypothetical protein
LNTLFYSQAGLIPRPSGRGMLIIDFPLPSFSYSYVIYRDEEIIDEIKIPLFIGIVLNSSRLEHFYVDNYRLKANTTYKYRVAVKVSLDYCSLDGIIHKEENGYVLNDASATTLSDVQR